jgi:hypothetical protein
VQRSELVSFLVGEPESRQAASPPVVHLDLEGLDPVVPLGDGGGRPGAGGQDDERVEDLLVETGGGGERSRSKSGSGPPLSGSAPRAARPWGGSDRVAPAGVKGVAANNSGAGVEGVAVRSAPDP